MLLFVIVVVSRLRLLFIVGSSFGRVQISVWLLLSQWFVVVAAAVVAVADAAGRALRISGSDQMLMYRVHVYEDGARQVRMVPKFGSLGYTFVA